MSTLTYGAQFNCTGTSARTIFGETTLRDLVNAAWRLAGRLLSGLALILASAAAMVAASALAAGRLHPHSGAG